MADMRHHAAHKEVKSPTEIVIDTEDSQKSDEEILNIIRTKYKAMYEHPVTKSYIEEMEPTLISTWRAKQMKIIAPSMVVLQ